MFRRCRLLVVPFFVSLIGCAREAAPDLEKARTSLREADDLYAKAGMAKNQADFLAFYASDAVVYPPGVDAVSGHPAISAFMDAIFKDTAFAATFQPAVVDVSADGSMGTTLAIADLTVTGPERETCHRAPPRLSRVAPAAGRELEALRRHLER